MKQFESTWRDGYNFFERVFDTTLQRSVKGRVLTQYEWYEPYSQGKYASLLDETVKLEKRDGNAKQGRNHYGFLDPMYRNIRDKYWNKPDGYNTTPRIWYLDIETRSGRSYKNDALPGQKIRIRKINELHDNHR